MTTPTGRNLPAASHLPASDGDARERILSAAAQLFYQRGIHQVGVDEIVTAAGVAKATLYRNFGSKDAVVTEWLRRHDQAWRGWLKRRVEARAVAPRKRLLAVFDALEEWFRSDDFRGCAFINSAVELANPAHPAFETSAHHKDAVRTYLLDLARQAGVADPDTLAAHMALLMEGAIVLALLRSDPSPAREARQAAERLLSGS